MKKKIVTLLFLVVFITFEVFAQQTKRITFEEQRLDGSIMGAITVNAVHVGWSQQQIFIENGMLIVHETWNVSWDLDGEWSPWKIANREPTRVSSTRSLFDQLLYEYYRNPRAAVKLHFDGFQAIRLSSIPNGKSTPLWWSDDGRSFYSFYEVWVIIP